MLASADLLCNFPFSLLGGGALSLDGEFPPIVGPSTENRSRKRVLQAQARQNAQAVSNCE
eukprot:COSAG02_NODE_159_length_32891_cov_17.822518_16_plen_60_part_00